MTTQKVLKRSKFFVGIDCGKNTGFAVWDSTKQQLVAVDTLLIHRALVVVHQLFVGGADIKVIIEDARQVKFKVSAEKAQGAGSVKRDALIWEDFCRDHGIAFELVRPNKVLTKWTAKYFKEQTGWAGSTTNHSRDAALLVWGR